MYKMGGGISARLLPVNLPDKTEYIEGEQLDLSGLSLKFEEIGGGLSTVSEYKTIPENGSILKRGISSIQVNYKKDNVLYSAFIPIIVKYAVGIEVASFPKHSYKTKNTLDTSGLKINLIYNDGSIKEIDNGFTTLPENGTVIGETTEIKIVYNNMVTYYKLNIDTFSSIINKSALVSNYLATFRSATDVQVQEMLIFHYSGYIDIADYWKVGDVRTFNQRSFPIQLKIIDLNRVINNENYAVVLMIEKYNISYEHIFSNDSKLIIDERRPEYFSTNKEYSASIKCRTTSKSYATSDSNNCTAYIYSDHIFRASPYNFTNKITFIIENIPDTDNYKCIMRNSETIYEVGGERITPLIKKYIGGGSESFKYFKTASNRKEVRDYMITDHHFKQGDLNYFSFHRVSGFAIDSYYTVDEFKVNLYAYKLTRDGNLEEYIVDRFRFLNIFSRRIPNLRYDNISDTGGIASYKSCCFL